MLGTDATELIMLSPKHIRLDPVPLRELLRGIRFMVKRGGETLKANATAQRLPKPAADLANVVIDEVMGLGHKVNARASNLAKSMFGTEPDTDIMLDDLTAQGESEKLFAATVYAAMKIVLARMDVSGMFVSEAAALNAFAAERKKDRHESVTQLAAALTLGLIDNHVLQGRMANSGRLAADAAVVPVAVFSVLLWLQSPRSEEDQEAALVSAVDLSLLMASQIEQGCRMRDIEAIAALYGKYAANV
mgnify:CR=1 FL=1